jgi:hypothetical protein
LCPCLSKISARAGPRCFIYGKVSFRLIVSGKIGVKEIERLIQKFEIDKEILADQEAAN